MAQNFFWPFMRFCMLVEWTTMVRSTATMTIRTTQHHGCQSCQQCKRAAGAVLQIPSFAGALQHMQPHWRGTLGALVSQVMAASQTQLVPTAISPSRPPPCAAPTPR